MRNAAKKEGRTVLYVSHNMNTIRQLCDRCVVLDKGKVIFEGDVEVAIDIYLGQGKSSPANVDLKNGKRSQEVADGVKLTEIRIISHDTWHTRFGDKLRFEITVKATKELKDVGFRSRVVTAEGISVTTLYAPALFSCKAGEEVKIPLEADIRQLVPGQYMLTPVLYGANEYGGWQFYDHVENSILFEVETIAGFNNNVPWTPQWAGNIKIPDLIDLRTQE